MLFDPAFLASPGASGEAGGGKKKKGPALAPHEERARNHGWAAAARKIFHDAGFKPYFDSTNFDVIMNRFEFEGAKVAFLVNDKRAYPAGSTSVEKDGVANEVELLIRDAREGLHAVDLATGKPVTLTKTAEGYTAKLTVPAA